LKLTVLRLGHRVGRDIRITTHVGLVARALGADEIVLSGQYDKGIINTLTDVAERWGGPFRVHYERNWLSFLKRKKEEGCEVIHLTVYGLPIGDAVRALRRSKRDKVVVVGSERVPSILYGLADWNVAVGSQPHSEVGALAVFLDRFFKGGELSKEFHGWMLKVVPQKRGKRVMKITETASCRGSGK